MSLKQNLDAESMKLFLQYGQLHIQLKSIKEQIADIESKLSAINIAIPIAQKLEAPKPADILKVKSE